MTSRIVAAMTSSRRAGRAAPASGRSRRRLSFSYRQRRHSFLYANSPGSLVRRMPRYLLLPLAAESARQKKCCLTSSGKTLKQLWPSNQSANSAAAMSSPLQRAAQSPRKGSQRAPRGRRIGASFPPARGREVGRRSMASSMSMRGSHAVQRVREQRRLRRRRSGAATYRSQFAPPAQRRARRKSAGDILASTPAPRQRPAETVGQMILMMQSHAQIARATSLGPSARPAHEGPRRLRRRAVC